MGRRSSAIHAVDLFCGVGGLSYGLTQAGVQVRAGIDIDSACEYAYERNNTGVFIKKDIRDLTRADIVSLYPKTGLRLLAGCAPCQPFSRHMRGADTSADSKWTLLDEFGRLVCEVLPDLVTMENVTGLARTAVFKRFLEALKEAGYNVGYASCYGPKFGLPQHRRRLVLVASLLGKISLPVATKKPEQYRTVRQAISALPALQSGEQDSKDPLHRARSLSEINLARLQASKPGGSWRDWPEELRAECHRRPTGQSFQSVYARMEWDEPSPTITTQSYNFGTGRFGHPEQDRALTLREAAILQGFPKSYAFIEKGEEVTFTTLGRLIGNAVPPPLGKAIGRALIDHVEAYL